MVEFKCEIINMLNNLKKDSNLSSNIDDYEHILLATKLNNNFSEEIFKLVTEELLEHQGSDL